MRFHSSFVLLKCFVKFLSWNKSFQVAKHVVTNFAKVIVNVIQSNSVIGEGNVFAKRGENSCSVLLCSTSTEPTLFQLGSTQDETWVRNKGRVLLSINMCSIMLFSSLKSECFANVSRIHVFQVHILACLHRCR